MTNDKKRLGLSVPKTLYEKLSALAEYHGKTINSTCLDIFWDYFKHGELHLDERQQENYMN